MCVLQLAGVALIAMGTYVYLKMDEYGETVEMFRLMPTLTIAVGIVVFVIAFFGCCGVLRDSYCMLVTVSVINRVQGIGSDLGFFFFFFCLCFQYAILLLVLFFVQAALGTYAYLKVERSDGDVQPLIRSAMKQPFAAYDTVVEERAAFDLIQSQLHCCGVDGPDDYKNKWQNGSVPASCCINFDARPCQLVSSFLISAPYYTAGCADRLARLVQDNLKLILYVSIGIALVEVSLCVRVRVRSRTTNV